MCLNVLAKSSLMWLGINVLKYVLLDPALTPLIAQNVSVMITHGSLMMESNVKRVNMNLIPIINYKSHSRRLLTIPILTQSQLVIFYVKSQRLSLNIEHLSKLSSQNSKVCVHNFLFKNKLTIMAMSMCDKLKFSHFWNSRTLS